MVANCLEPILAHRGELVIGERHIHDGLLAGDELCFGIEQVGEEDNLTPGKDTEPREPCGFTQSTLGLMLQP